MQARHFAFRILILLAACGSSIATINQAAAQPVVPATFVVDTFAVVTRPSAMVFAPAGSAFGSELYVAGNVSSSSLADSVFRVSAAGVVTPFAVLVPDADPQDMAFPPAGSPYGDFLYLSANNRDFGQPLDCGGTIQQINNVGTVVDFTALVGCASCGTGGAGLGEPVGLAFGTGGAFGNGLYVGNSSDVPGDICEVSTGGGITTFVDDALCSPNGLAPLGVAFSPGGAFGDGLYFTDFGVGCDCVRIADSLGSAGAPFASFSQTPFDLEFAPGSAFGSDLFVGVGDTLHQIAPDGSVSVFGYDFGDNYLTFTFSPNGEELYVSSHSANIIYRIRTASVSVPTMQGRGDLVRLYPGSPNPFTTTTTLRFDLARSGKDATVLVYSTTGRLVRDLTPSHTATSLSRSALWDGRDATGSRVAAGVYFYRVESDGVAKTGKITMVR